MKIFLSLLSLISISCFAEELRSCEQQREFMDDLRLQIVMPTPEPNNVSTHIFFPKEKELYKTEDIYTWIRIEGFPLGIFSDFPRAKILRNDRMGQSIHINIDNYPYFAAYRDLLDALDVNENYFDESFNMPIPFDLGPGKHVLRAYPTRSYGESLKGEGTYEARIFYIDEKIDDPSMNIDLPYLTYNEPQGEFDYNPNEPILLDFYVQNALLTPSGYKVRLTINDVVKKDLTVWTPYYIWNLPKGKNKIRLQLLDPDGEIVPCVLNDVERTIILK